METCAKKIIVLSSTSLAPVGPFDIFQHGRPCCAIESPHVYLEREESMMLFQLIAESEQDKAANQFFTKKELLAGL